MRFSLVSLLSQRFARVFLAEGDPKRIAELVLKLANTQDVPKRLILGKDAEARVRNVEAARTAEAEEYRDLTLSTVYTDAPVIPASINR